MNCNIDYIGKFRNGKKKYWCKAHKSLAPDDKICTKSNKDLFDNPIHLNKENVTSIVLTINDANYDLQINGEPINKVVIIDNSILELKDFIGLMLLKINNIPVEEVHCKRCSHLHSDNGYFAYTPHKKHLCNYCGHEFIGSHKNVSHELDVLFSIPEINYDFRSTNATIEYDFLECSLKTSFKNYEALKEYVNEYFKNSYEW